MDEEGDFARRADDPYDYWKERPRHSIFPGIENHVQPHFECGYGHNKQTASAGDILLGEEELGEKRRRRKSHGLVRGSQKEPNHDHAPALGPKQLLTLKWTLNQGGKQAGGDLRRIHTQVRQGSPDGLSSYAPADTGDQPHLCHSIQAFGRPCSQ